MSVAAPFPQAHPRMQAPQRLRTVFSAIPWLRWPARLLSVQGDDVTTVYGFIRRYLPFNFAVMTAIAFIIKLLFWEPEQLGMALTFSYCIGGFIFVLLMV